MAKRPSAEISKDSEGDEAEANDRTTLHAKPPFCCDEIYPIKDPKTDNEWGIWYFANLIKIPSNFPKHVRKYPTSLLIDCWLHDTDSVIEYENYEGAEKVESRYFFPQPDISSTSRMFVEMEPEMVNWDVWKKDWETLKLRCDVHPGDRHWWVVRLLERVDPDAEGKEVSTVKRKKKSDLVLDKELQTKTSQ